MEIKMAMGSDSNNIEKSDATDFMTKNVSPRDKDYVINALVNTTLYGWEYPAEKRNGMFEMSYYCRAYNITRCGPHKDRIKGRYRKYEQVQGIEDYFRQVLKNNWPGFEDEQPRMDDILEKFAKEANQQSAASQQMKSPKPQSRNTYQRSIGKTMRRVGNTGNASPGENHENSSNNWRVGAVGFVVLLIIVFFS
jgi:hypothetical protein